MWSSDSSRAISAGLASEPTFYRDGTTHLVLSPLEFMQRLAALVRRPRLHVIRFHGVLASGAARQRSARQVCAG
jgi:putative transposase